MNVVLHEHVLHAFTPGDRPPFWRQRSGRTQFTLHKVALCALLIFLLFSAVKVVLARFYASDARSLVETRLLRTHAGTHDE
jgi:hypothetical protein